MHKIGQRYSGNRLLLRIHCNSSARRLEGLCSRDNSGLIVGMSIQGLCHIDRADGPMGSKMRRRAFGLLGFPSRYVGTYFTVKIVTNSEQTNDEYYLLLAMISPNTIKSNHQRCLFTF